MKPKPLTAAQLDFLSWVDTHGSHTDYAGTSQQLRETLVQRGFLLHNGKPWSAGQRHLRFTRYTLTELGRDVLCGAAFQKGLEAGLAALHAEVDERLAVEARQRELETMRSFGTTEGAVREVRRAFGIIP